MPKYNCGMGNPFDMLAEECAEVIQIAMKINRFGINSYNPDDPIPNWKLLTQELGDVLAITDILIDQGCINRDNLDVARQHKIKRLEDLFGFKLSSPQEDNEHQH